MINMEYRLKLIVAGNAELPVPAEFIYDPADPISVRAVFHAAGDTVYWVFSRELLASGLNDDSGLGDVRIWPGQDGDVIYISLCSPEGEALLRASATDMRQFLDMTYESCPIDEDVVDWDSVITRILEEA